MLFRSLAKYEIEMKVIKRIEDLKRVYRLRNLILEKDEKIIIDYAKLLSDHIGLNRHLVDLAITANKRIKKGYIKSEENKILKDDRLKETNELILNFESINNEFQNHLKNKIGKDVLNLIKDQYTG